MPRFSAEWILPIAGPPIRHGEVVTGEDGTIVEVRPLSSSKGIAAGSYILPGLVNAHVHFELSLLARRVPGGAGLPPWIAALVAARIGLDAKEVRRAAARAIKEAVALGTVAVGEITNTLETVWPIAEAGLAGVVFHELLDLDVRDQTVPTANSATTAMPTDAVAATTAALRRAQAKRAALVGADTTGKSDGTPYATGEPTGKGTSAADATGKGNGDGKGEGGVHWPAGLAYALTPHAPVTTSPRLIAAIMKATPSAPISIHAAEDPAERELLTQGRGPFYDLLAASGLFDLATIVSGLGPIDHLAQIGLLDRKVPPLLVHMVDTTADERARVAAAGCPVVLCPRSNLHIGNRLPDVPALRNAGIALCLGTDSLASNASLSIWSEMATLAGAFPALPPQEIVTWATLGGSRALGLGDRLGTLEPGKRPGILALNKPGPSCDDPYRFVVTAEPTTVEVSWLLPAASPPSAG